MHYYSPLFEKEKAGERKKRALFGQGKNPD